MSPTLPPLRQIDAFPFEHEGETLIALNDQSGYVEHQLVLSPAAFYIAAMLDGQHDLEGIQAAFAHEFGMAASPEEIMAVVSTLSRHGFLMDETFLSIVRETQVSFAAAPARPAYLAGRSYPEDADELRAMIDGFFTRDGSPMAGLECADAAAEPLPCLVVPHIDFHRGGHSYAHGYRALYAQGKPDVVFIFGVAHDTAPVPFILTRKDFETPFGTLETDRELVSKLEQACVWDPYEHELVHRTEHSAEFQAVMLAYLYGPAVRIVPVLTSCFSDDPTMARPETVDAVRSFLDTCAEIAANGRRVSVIAGADLAHVGKRFGDEFDIDTSILSEVAARDHEDLAHVLRPRHEDFYASVMKDLNARRVCGLGCIYAALYTAGKGISKGRLLHYGSAPDPAGGIVSFASVALQ